MLLQTFLLFQVLTSLGSLAHGSEIVQGEKVPEGEMLFMASVQDIDGHMCGGFLIREDFVLTAAHCSGGLTHVVVGTHDLGNLRKQQTQKIRIEKEFMHSCFGEGMEGDIMLLKLSRKAQLNNKVATIKLPTPGPHETENCRVVGWGLTRTEGPGVDELRQANVPVISRGRCKETWEDLPASVVCAGGFNTTKGFCNGDSGGPLVCNGAAVGIVSYSAYECAEPFTPDVYTRVLPYKDWITNVLDNN